MLLCGVQASQCSGFSCCGARALGARASVVVACGLSSRGAQAYLLRGTWDLPGPGLEPVFPALAGGFLTTVPPGKPPGEAPPPKAFYIRVFTADWSPC